MTSSCKIANVVSELWKSRFRKMVGVDFKKKASEICLSFAKFQGTIRILFLTFGYKEWNPRRTDIISEPEAVLL